MVLREDQRSGELQLSIRRAEEALVWRRLRQSLEEGAAVEGLVTSFNAAGLMVDVQGQKGFVPGSHVPNNVMPEDLVGRRLALKLLEVDEERQRLVLSNRRRASSSGGRTFRVGEWMFFSFEFFLGRTKKKAETKNNNNSPLFLFSFYSLSLSLSIKHQYHQATSSSARSRPCRSTARSSIWAEASTVRRRRRRRRRRSFFLLREVEVERERRNPKTQNSHPSSFSLSLSSLFFSHSSTGLLHVSQISHDHVATIDKVLAPGDKIKVLVLTHDRERGRISLSTKKLEPTPGDMLRNPAAVFERADEMAAQFRALMKEAEAAAREGEGAAPAAAAAAPAAEEAAE